MTFGALACALTAQSAMAETLRVGTHPTFAPFEFLENDKITGFDIDVINAIAKANGDTVELVSTSFDGLIPSLITSNIDVIVSGMTITEARQKRVDFTDGYYDSYLSILVRQDDTKKYRAAKDLAGQTICVQLGTTGHEFAKTLSKDKVKAFNNEPDAITELTNKGCEAVINDRPVNLYYLQKYNTRNQNGSVELANIVDKTMTVNVDKFGMAVRKGNTELLNKLNAGYKKIQENGELDAIYVKWFGEKEGTAADRPQTLEVPATDAAKPMTLEMPAPADAKK